MGDSAIHALAGSVGGCVSMVCLHFAPLVNLSTRAAVQTKKENVTIPEAIARTIKTEGISGLYSGLSSSLFGIAVTNGVYYAFYEEARSFLIRRRKTGTNLSALSTSEGILAGLVAGSITTLLTNPIWTVQTAQSTKAVATTPTAAGAPVAGDAAPVKKTKLSASQAVREIMKQDGLKGFWRGIGPALILVINPVIQYTTFERLVAVLLAYRLKRFGSAPTTKQQLSLGRSSLSDWDMFFLGALSKLAATGTTYPYIVVKSRLQAATHKYNSSIRAVLDILQKEGLGGLYAGLAPKLIQSCLTASILFLAQRRIFEAVKKVR
ncbi:mitochondrial carrier domain-containing protein [Dioszegia hungarica]|uniref:Mitochondrial carrier domain-containing protein n=1 Tax=Dioszegia hungarica TaxID=4972 RepID=A0AA38LWG4_9TREE|nr:mitochondrial carrier domain-containing protein [Dioszegia hungarica]KAI9637753.1 mitochondrial carrier domain-containing protein [Dioszegia hungarica]